MSKPRWLASVQMLCGVCRGDHNALPDWRRRLLSVIAQTHGSSASNRGGFNVGGGLNFGLLAFKTFAEARYTWVAAANGSTTFVPITVGLML
jgi:hypothetical protein